ncbi:hypothetical protein [Caudoviricetes sp.]|nr:hypothetical protein [Caudoviricetes sp.]UOF81019.1 hypothetical protein [Caudoviricetes sp.]UOF81415.1 hypothetical protein [Caudoviricetes sp.]
MRDYIIFNSFMRGNKKIKEAPPEDVQFAASSMLKEKKPMTEVPCKRCRSKGYVEGTYATEDGYEETGAEQCQLCNGSGKVPEGNKNLP